MLAFIHIPKTAGTTLHKIIFHQYPARRIRIRHDSEGEGEIPDLREVDVVMGHQSVGLHHQVKGVRYVACLRHPVGRIRSLFEHARHDPTHYLHGQASGMRLAEFAAGGWSGELSDGMTRMLAGVRAFHDDPVDESVLETAKSNVREHFAGLVLSERFDEGAVLLARRLSWSAPFYIRRKVGRYTPGAAPPDERDREAILRANRIDLALYEWACGWFDEQAASLGTEFAVQVEAFHKANRRKGAAVYWMREFKRRILRW